MKPEDADKNAVADTEGESGEPKRESFLYSLWKKVTTANKTQQKPEKKQEEIPAEPEPQPVLKEVPAFEKMAAPECLMKLYDLWQKEQGNQQGQRFLVEDFCGNSSSNLLPKFVSQIESRACNYLKKRDILIRQNHEMIEKYLLQMEKKKQEEKEGGESGSVEFTIPPEALAALEMPPPMAGEIVLLTAPDWSEAWCMVFPALNGGNPVTADAICRAMDAQGITYGRIDQAIEELSSPLGCLTLLPIARGTAPVPGVDGKVIDHFPRTIGSPYFIEDAQGIVDFSNLNWLVPIEKDTVICEVVPAIKGIPGTDIRNRPIKAADGKKPVLPMGQNVELNADGTALVAKVSGQISFKDNKFQITSVVIIPGNVDLSTGNLNVRGDLVIQGNVLAGFTVQASGDITIGGLVEGAQVSSGGSIIVNRGMNGNMVGNMTAKKNIYCKYMENASVQTDGDIYMDSIVNCEVACNGRIVTKTGRGVIIGGHLVAMAGIEAKIIGNKTGRVTVMSIEATPQFLQEKEALERDIFYLESELRQRDFSQSTGASALEHKILQMKMARMKRRLEEMQEQEASVSRGQILAGHLYPIVQLSMNGTASTVLKPYDQCRIYFDAVSRNVKIIS